MTARPAHAAATVAQVRARAADAAKKSASQIASRITKLLPQSVINPAPSQSGQGKSLARELLEACRPLVQGTYLVPSFGRYEVVGELVTRVHGTADG